MSHTVKVQVTGRRSIDLATLISAKVEELSNSGSWTPQEVYSALALLYLGWARLLQQPFAMAVAAIEATQAWAVENNIYRSAEPKVDVT